MATDNQVPLLEVVDLEVRYGRGKKAFTAVSGVKRPKPVRPSQARFMLTHTRGAWNTTLGCAVGA